jgi:hypothetical protein
MAQAEAVPATGTWVIPERARRARVLGHLPGARIAGSACALHLPAARSVWPLTNDLGALDLSARSGADRVHDAGADQADLARLETAGMVPDTPHQGS